jgi:hypothetical protein
MLYLIADYMTPELLDLFQELYKTGAYFIRYHSKLNLLVIYIPTINIPYEFGVPEVRRQLLLHIFWSENLQPTLPMTELLLRQLPVIQY